MIYYYRDIALYNRTENAGKTVSGAVLEQGGFEPYPMIRRKFPEAKNKPGTILTSY
ncbi:MAG: hypothetical protein UV70_C0005G0023 [Parcubacteria group bacterium GW2011_GWA2_43_13]|nr:MAG: hypothetical protein UV70_C0005G0023 [Parcubacteria group bacterium GW2011_GWA2_43_13]